VACTVIHLLHSSARRDSSAKERPQNDKGDKYLCKIESDLSHPKKIRTQLGIFVFLRPQVERDARQFIDDWNRVSVFGKVDGFDVSVAGVAGFYPDVVELASNKNRQQVFILFAATGTDDPAKVPLGGAE